MFAQPFLFMGFSAHKPIIYQSVQPKSILIAVVSVS